MIYNIGSFLDEYNPIKGVGYIYKITSPSGRIYVGQSINLKQRVSKYKNISCTGQIVLYNSLKKYGVSNHSFEILEIITEDVINQLNVLEAYYIGVFDCIKTGLNSHFGGSNKIPNAATRAVMSMSQKLRDKSTYRRGHSLTEEHNTPFLYSLALIIGQMERQQAKLSAAKKGVKQSEQVVQKRADAIRGHVAWNKGFKSAFGKITNANKISAN